MITAVLFVRFSFFAHSFLRKLRLRGWKSQRNKSFNGTAGIRGYEIAQKGPGGIKIRKDVSGNILLSFPRGSFERFPLPSCTHGHVYRFRFMFEFCVFGVSIIFKLFLFRVLFIIDKGYSLVSIHFHEQFDKIYFKSRIEWAIVGNYNMEQMKNFSYKVRQSREMKNQYTSARIQEFLMVYYYLKHKIPLRRLFVTFSTHFGLWTKLISPRLTQALGPGSALTNNKVRELLANNWLFFISSV